MSETRALSPLRPAPQRRNSRCDVGYKRFLEPPKPLIQKEEFRTTSLGRHPALTPGLAGDVASLASALIKLHFDGIPSRRIDESFARARPMTLRVLRRVLIAPALEQRSEQHDETDANCLPSMRAHAGSQ